MLAEDIICARSVMVIVHAIEHLREHHDARPTTHDEFMNIMAVMLPAYYNKLIYETSNKISTQHSKPILELSLKKICPVHATRVLCKFTFEIAKKIDVDRLANITDAMDTTDATDTTQLWRYLDDLAQTVNMEPLAPGIDFDYKPVEEGEIVFEIKKN